MITTTLRDATLNLVTNRPAHLKLKQIADDTGVPEGWLKIFAQGRIEDPSVNRIETIYNYLSDKTLKV